MVKMNAVDWVARILVIIGALNWGLVAIADKAELVQYLQAPVLITIVYALVGLAGIWEVIKLFSK